ncbi:MAG: tetratricopeptide repeat protein [Bacteroidetes bacterium]|nr:tetratricopeptide repeat protein [Bacteroidota bacterium]
MSFGTFGLRISCLLLLGLGVLTPPRISWSQEIDRTAEQHFESALQLFGNNLFANAADKFDNFQQQNVGHARVPEAMYYEAESYLAMGRSGDAIRLLTRFDELYPQHPFAFGTRLSLGKYFFEIGDYQRAITTLSQVLDRSPTLEQSALALYWMGESAHQLGREDEAIGYFERVVSEFPTTETAPRAAYAIAFNQIQLGRYDAAAASFERLAAKYPGTEFANKIGLALAEVYYELNDYPRASVELQKQMPNLSGESKDRATFLLAESFNQLRDSENAIINYRFFTENNTDNPYYLRAVYGLAWNYYYEGAFQWAADNFRTVLDANHPTLSSESAYYEGVSLKQAANANGAIAALSSYTNQYPEHHLADHGLLELGLVQYEQALWQDAHDSFLKLVSTYPDSKILGEALNHLGNTSIAIGDFDEALRAFDRAIALDAADPTLIAEITFQKAWLLYRNRNYTDAAAQFIKLFSDGKAGAKASEALFWAAESYFQLGSFDRAEGLFKRYLNEYPNAEHKEAIHYALGWTYFRQGNYSSAIPAFERFLNLYKNDTGSVPYRSDAQLRLADSYFALKRYAEAVRVYTRMAAEGDDYALYQIGQAYSNSGDAFEAISTFRQLIEEYPTSEWREETQYSLGYLYFISGEYEQAIKEYQTLIASFPRNPLAAKAQYGIGDAYYNDGKINEAVRAYQEVLTKYPDSPFVADAAAGIQFALMAAGQDARADAVVDSLANVLRGTPAAEQLKYRQAEAKYQSGRLREALANFESFISFAKQPELLGRAHFYAAEILLAQNAVSRAEQHYNSVVQRYPSSDKFPDAAYSLGHIYLGQNKGSAADDIFSQMESKSGANPRNLALARYGRSLALIQLNRLDEAERILQSLTADGKMTENSYPAFLGLAQIALKKQDFTRAEQILTTLSTSARDEIGAEALFLLGSSQIGRKQYDRGVETLGRMQALFSGYPEWLSKSYLEQGRAFEALGNPGQAIRLYEIVVSMYPDSSSFKTAKARLDDLR